ncbi:Vacuolar protein sorting-associated protein 13B [Acipenser ruthenus]|uniref:Vacuolar protein sorting-associated protein 13B n=1 Tax=Acipenser ruthenus TaxID=7906 RepID=A0A444U966_ACIRT|nr:Vacuolar protein sorting-associated protein 13B [Acipenser ruthenus]
MVTVVLDGHGSCGSSSTNRSTTESVKSLAKPRRIHQAAPTDPDLPPVNNLILKYVEDNIVLSVNITSAECYTIDEFWDRAFMDISRAEDETGLQVQHTSQYLHRDMYLQQRNDDEQLTEMQTESSYYSPQKIKSKEILCMEQEGMTIESLRPLPALRIQVDKVNLEHSVPMYADQLVNTVSSLSQPSDNLIHHCYAHCYLKEYLAYPTVVGPETKRAFVPIAECIFELPNFTMQATRAQTLLLQAICQSWTHNMGNGASPGVNEALLNEVYIASGTALTTGSQYSGKSIKASLTNMAASPLPVKMEDLTTTPNSGYTY